MIHLRHEYAMILEEEEDDKMKNYYKYDNAFIWVMAAAVVGTCF